MADVHMDITRERFMDELRPQFSTVRAWAMLDGDGWHESGKVGWFACHDGTAETMASYSKAYTEKMSGGDQGDWFVFVDCHI